MVVNYKKILSYNLEKMGVRRPEKVYELLDSLGESPDIGCPTLDVASGRPIIVAEYKGGKEIGGARIKKSRCVSPEITKNVREIFNNLPKVEGISVRNSYPSLGENKECYGTIVIDGEPIEIVLKKVS